MNSDKYPILEYDQEKRAIIEPSQVIPRLDVPEYCIIPYYNKVFTFLKKKEKLRQITQEETIVTFNLPLYEMKYKNNRLAIMTPGITAPFAAAILEFVIATGCKKFIIVGSCGVLDKKIIRNQLIIPTSAIRDEGTSYHYLPASREIQADPMIVAKIKESLDEKKINYITGKTWTTDAFYRETPEKIKKRREEGAIVVEMEAAALFAVAQFRNVKIGYILNGGDDVSGFEWDPRLEKKSNDFHENLFELAADICLKL